MPSEKRGEVIRAQLVSKAVLNSDERELYELAQLAGVLMDPEVFKIILDLLKLNVPPATIVQTLKSMCSNHKQKEEHKEADKFLSRAQDQRHGGQSRDTSKHGRATDRRNDKSQALSSYSQGNSSRKSNVSHDRTSRDNTDSWSHSRFIDDASFPRQEPSLVHRKSGHSSVLQGDSFETTRDKSKHK